MYIPGYGEKGLSSLLPPLGWRVSKADSRCCYKVKEKSINLVRCNFPHRDIFPNIKLKLNVILPKAMYTPGYGDEKGLSSASPG